MRENDEGDDDHGGYGEFCGAGRGDEVEYPQEGVEHREGDGEGRGKVVEAFSHGEICVSDNMSNRSCRVADPCSPLNACATGDVGAIRPEICSNDFPRSISQARRPVKSCYRTWRHALRNEITRTSGMKDSGPHPRIHLNPSQEQQPVPQCIIHMHSPSHLFDTFQVDPQVSKGKHDG